MLNTVQYERYSPQKRRAQMKYETSGKTEGARTRSNKKLLTQNQKHEKVEPLPSPQLSPPETASNLDLNKQPRSSRNNRPQPKLENQSNTCDVHEQKYYINEIGQMKADLQKLKNAEEELINNGQIEQKESSVIKETRVTEEACDKIGESSPNVLYDEAIPDTLLDNHPAL